MRWLRRRFIDEVVDEAVDILIDAVVYIFTSTQIYENVTAFLM
jgi:hypothetical protein